MKTAISVPDEIFVQATRRAAELGISRSAFFAHTGPAAMPGIVFLPAASSGLPKDSVVNVTALVTLDKTDLDAETSFLSPALMSEVDRGLRRILEL